MAATTHSAKAPAARTTATPTATPKSSSTPVSSASGSAAPAAEVAPGVLELKGMGAEFKPSPVIASFLDGRKLSTVNAKFGALAAGPIEIKTRKAGSYDIKNQRIPLQHPAFARIAEAAPGLAPVLVLNVRDKSIEGRVGLAMGAKLESISDQIKKAPEILGLFGVTFSSGITLINKLEGGSLHFGLSGVPIRLGQAFSGTFSLRMVDESIAFEGGADVQVKGLAQGRLSMARSAEGLLTGQVAVGLTLPKNITGSVDVKWDGRALSGEGKVGYSGEKLSGEVTLRMMEKGEAERLEAEKKAPEGAGKPVAAEPGKAPKGKVDYAIFGEGDLTFAFTDWLNGTAHVIVDPKGFVTVIGKITPQKEFILFKQKDYERQLFKVEARASYGLPVVGNIFIFANVSMSAFATLGPGKFYNIVVEGTYSTDPEKSKSFSIRGSLNISAAAGLKLRGEAGAGLEILSHDIKAGAGVNGIAGIKGYAEATPIIGYREKAAPGKYRRGLFSFRGELAIAAQPFLGLSGDLFVEVDAPWWSPVPDKRWTWPLFNKEWPIGGSLGVGASVDYVFGSNEWPKLDFKPIEFDSTKFMSDLYSDKAKSGSGKEQESKGKWGEKNSKAADPPPKKPPVGNAKPGKGATPPSAKSKVQPGSSGKNTKLADPSARTKEGKTVKQLQDEATKKGKKPAGGEAGKGGKQDAAAKGKTAEGRDEEVKQALAALEQVTARYAKDGATKDEVTTGVKAVRRKFSKVFKSLTVVDGGDTWDYDYEMSPGTKKKGAKKKEREWPTGSATDPFPIKWFKPHDGLYPTITIGSGSPRTPRQGVTLPQIKETPARQLKVSGDNFLDVGVKLKRRTGRDDSKKDIVRRHIDNLLDNAPLGSKSYFSGSKKYSVDHVRDYTWGGKEAFDNLWPLSTTDNDAVNAVLNQQVMGLENDKPVPKTAQHWGTDKYFVVAEVAKSKPSDKGDHGTTKANPINSGSHGTIPKRWNK